MPSVVDITYDDPRTGQRVRERRTQEISNDEVERVRQRERDLVLAPRRPDSDQDLYYRGNRDYYGRDQRNAYLDIDYPPPNSRRRRHRSVSRRRSPSPSSSSSSSSDDDGKRRRRRQGGHRRARSAVDQKDNAGDDGGVCWWSHKERKDANLLEKNLDSSYDGLIAAAAGAVIGGMTARRFAHKEGDPKSQERWKILGGAVAGGLAFNAAENKYRVFTEEKLERKIEQHYERD